MNKNSKNTKLNTKKIRLHKRSVKEKPLSMLTCYDYQTAQLLNETELDLILVGDSLGNVILGMKDTIGVTVDHMCLFGKAVRRGAPSKFIVVDMPFGSTNSMDKGLHAAEKIMRETGCDSVKIEGAAKHVIELIERLTRSGIPVMGHIGLIPQSVHQLGGYYRHGKDENSAELLVNQAVALENAGCHSIVLECVESDTATRISERISIPTIGIGSGKLTDGQVLVINDLLKMEEKKAPSFVKPIADLYNLKKDLISLYLMNQSYPLIDHDENTLHH